VPHPAFVGRFAIMSKRPTKAALWLFGGPNLIESGQTLEPKGINKREEI